MVPLCRQLSTSFNAGIPIIRTIENVGSMNRDRKVKRVLIEMGDALKKGSTLGDAAHAQSKYFSPFFVQLLAVGERGGHLDVMLKDLAQYFEDRLQMQRDIRSAMAIPMIQLCAAWFAGTFVYGIFDVITAGTGVTGVKEYFGVYVAFQMKAAMVFALLFFVAVILSRLGLFGWITGAFTTFVWPLSIVTRKFALARFFRSFALLLGGGISVIKCIEGSATVVANPYIAKDLSKSIEPIRQGATLVEAMNHTRQLTPMAREMLVVGEESGNLEAQMEKISEYHLAEANQAVAMATKAFGVLIMVAVGCLVGYIVISFYSRLYGDIFNELGI